MLFFPIDGVIKVIASKHVVKMHFNVHDTQLLKLDYDPVTEIRLCLDIFWHHAGIPNEK